MGADGLRVGLHGPFLNDQLIVDLSGLQSSGVVITSGLEGVLPEHSSTKIQSPLEQDLRTQRVQ